MTFKTITQYFINDGAILHVRKDAKILSVARQTDPHGAFHDIAWVLEGPGEQNEQSGIIDLKPRKLRIIYVYPNMSTDLEDGDIFVGVLHQTRGELLAANPEMNPVVPDPWWEFVFCREVE